MAQDSDSNSISTNVVGNNSTATTTSSINSTSSKSIRRASSLDDSARTTFEDKQAREDFRNNQTPDGTGCFEKGVRVAGGIAMGLMSIGLLPATVPVVATLGAVKAATEVGSLVKAVVDNVTCLDEPSIDNTASVTDKMRGNISMPEDAKLLASGEMGSPTAEQIYGKESTQVNSTSYKPDPTPSVGVASQGQSIV